MPTTLIPEQQFNIPTRLDPGSLDLLERWVSASLITAPHDLTADAITALRPIDF